MTQTKANDGELAEILADIYTTQPYREQPISLEAAKAAIESLLERRVVEARIEQITQDFHSMFGYDCFGSVSESELENWRNNQLKELEAELSQRDEAGGEKE